ncbi:hypothetical protein [Bacillus gaemokensis]|uniref:Calcineurin-like phosphoesterase domain-containing protein n=1 Tax=Bacillus gaemokensis TaxID=574375 RepID=A0A073KNP5_9BACI|nr:hypothetical protein [Bacillus gaemokensis]KEK23968.1 hypothetical protein BAGA_06040 [Bacillus gaemokensis]KYG38089.1 hypothetical protein AZF08_20270 [Bacillus gaemokensis]
MAVRLKLELQKASPSRKISWKLHKELMEKEGFFDSEASEIYRVMVKSYQKSIGKLPTAPTHADMVTSNKLESIKELVGDIAWEKRENQGVLRKLNKTKRELIDYGLLVQEVVSAVRKELSDLEFNFTFEPITTGNSRMIAVFTDWHLGALVDVEGNKYNYEVAVRRINETLSKLYKIAVDNNVKQIDVVYCGDMLEHAYMRESQSYHAEFFVSEQIARGGKVLIQVLTELSKHFVVTYQGFSGNHDRINGNKNNNIDGDTGMVVVNEIVKTYIETVNIGSLFYIKSHSPFSAQLLNINGRNIKLVHGDLEKKADKGKLADHSDRDNIIYDAIVMGHFHHFEVIEVGDDKFEILIGSIKGSDDYSKKLGLSSSPSQGAILVYEDGEIKVERIRVK